MMNKFITEKKELLEMFSEATNKVNPKMNEKEVEPVLDKALYNFQREMNAPIEDFKDTPNDLKAHIFQILIKHFIIGLKNETVFRDEKTDEITKQIEDLMD